MISSGVWDGSSSALLESIGNAHSKIAAPAFYAPYVPFSLWMMLHATRIACAYRGAARAGGYDGRITNIQAALVPMILVFGGTTVTNVLLGIVPGWVISPLPLINYAIIPVLVAKTPILSILLSIPVVPRELAFSFVDGFSRVVGITLMGVETVVNHHNPALRNSPWAMLVIGTLAGGGGGIIVPGFNGFHADWSFSTPPYVRNGPSVDIWGATVVAYLYSTLVDAHPFFRLLPAYLDKNVPFFSLLINLPKGYLSNPERAPLLPVAEARTLCAIVLSLMLAGRVLQPLLKSSSTPRQIKVGKPAGKPSSGKGKAKTQ